MKHDMGAIAQDLNTVRIYHMGSDKKPPIEIDYGGMTYTFRPLGQQWEKTWGSKQVPLNDGTDRTIKLQQPMWRPLGNAKDPKTGKPYTQNTVNYVDVPIAAIKSWWETGSTREKFFDNSELTEDEETGAPRAKQILLTERMVNDARMSQDSGLDEEIREKQATLAAVNAQLAAAKALKNPPASPNT